MRGYITQSLHGIAIEYASCHPNHPIGASFEKYVHPCRCRIDWPALKYLTLTIITERRHSVGIAECLCLSPEYA